MFRIKACQKILNQIKVNFKKKVDILATFITKKKLF